MGFDTYPSMPAARHRSRSPFIALAVMAMIRSGWAGGVWDSRSRKPLEHFEPVALQASIVTDPKRRVDRERVNVRQKIARLIHYVDGDIAIWNANVHVQSKNEVRAGEQLHILYNLLIALAFSDELIVPM